MNPTNLLYLEQMYELTHDAVVEQTERQDDRQVVILDQTIFYPQGGGQPYDTGVIENEDSRFVVEEVRFADGLVRHIGHFEGRPFISGEDVHCVVNKERRMLNSRLHSAGHLVDMAVAELKLDWPPTKGYHFPDSPYVEYAGTLDPDQREELIRQLQTLCRRFIAENAAVTCKLVSRTELEALCRFVPPNLPTNKPIRVVQFDGFAVPCGGTHVHSLKEIGEETITKLKKKDQSIRVGYNINR